MIAFMTWNSNLVPLLEGLCWNPCRFESLVFYYTHAHTHSPMVHTDIQHFLVIHSDMHKHWTQRSIDAPGTCLRHTPRRHSLGLSLSLLRAPSHCDDILAHWHMRTGRAHADIHFDTHIPTQTRIYNNIRSQKSSKSSMRRKGGRIGFSSKCSHGK